MSEKTAVRDTLELWKKVEQPPSDVLRRIEGGRLKNKTDIDPMWRIKKLTELYGPIGFGWKYEIVRLWSEQGKYLETAACHEIIANAHIKLYIKVDGEWSDGIDGVGGNTLVEREGPGAYTNDEGYKMAVTDAISVACKELGFGADIYLGRWDGSKYNIPVDQDAVATWLIACQKEANETDRDEFKKWWPANSDTIKEECQIAGAASVHDAFMQLLEQKGSK